MMHQHHAEPDHRQQLRGLVMADEKSITKRRSIKVGDKFGRLTALSFCERRGSHYYWCVKCDCGEERIVLHSALTGGHTKSCGCLNREMSGQRLKRFKDTFSINAGDRFGKLVAMSLHERRGRNKAYWSFQCDCGNVTVAAMSEVKYGKTQSCGCLRIEISGNINRSHSMSKSSEYHSWCSINGRCANLMDKAYPQYGGRGITVCERWRKFEAFYADMGPRPVGTSIDRINNDGPYSPENCRWASRTQQARNTRRNINVTLDGKIVCLKEASQILGLPYGTVSARVRRGWTPERALGISK